MPNIPANIGAAAADGRIPSGISLEYLAESRDQSSKIAILFVAALTFVLVVMRGFVRLFLIRSFGLDDALALLTLALYIPIIALCMVLIDLGSGRHIEYIQYVLSLSQVNETEILDFTVHILYTTALFLCRLSGLAFYHRLASHHNKISLVIKLSASFLAIVYLAQFFLLLFHCYPVTGLWPYGWQPEVNDYTCITWGDVYSVNSGLSLACDLMMLIIPSRLIHTLHVSKKRKLQLSLLLFPGVLVLIVSSFRVYLVVVGQWAADGSWYYDPMLAIETSEIGGTLIALSIPALKPLFGNLFSHIKTYSTSRGDRSRGQSQQYPRENANRWDQSIKLSALGHTAVKINSGVHISSQASNENRNLKKDSSSEDLLTYPVSAAAPKDWLVKAENRIQLTQEVSVSSEAVSYPHERP